MNPSTRNSILPALVIFLAAVFAAGFLFPRSGEVYSDSMHGGFLGRDEAKHVIAMNISTQSWSASFASRDGTWFLERDGREYPARLGRIEALLDELAAIREFRRVASDPGSWTSYGLDDETSWKLDLRIAKRSLPRGIRFGFTDESGESIFVRRAEEKNSWRIDSGIFRALGGKLEEWTERSLFPRGERGVDLQSLDMIPGSDSIPSWSIVRNGNGWKFRPGSKPSAAPVLQGRLDEEPASIVHAVLSMEAASFAGLDGIKPGPAPGARVAKLILQGGEGSSVEIELSRDPETGSLEARVSGRNWVYILASESLAGILP